VASIGAARRQGVKWSFVTRRVDCRSIEQALMPMRPVSTGTVVVARVLVAAPDAVVEDHSGRLAHVFPGDDVVVVWRGMSQVADDADGCALAWVLASSSGLVEDGRPDVDLGGQTTLLRPIGLVPGHHGAPLTLDQVALGPFPPMIRRPWTIAVCGTGAAAGRTASAAALVRRAVAGGRSVGAAKVGGTAAGADLWRLSDAGAELVLDDVDAGIVPSGRGSIDALEAVFRTVVHHLAAAGVDDIVLELGGGLLSPDVAALLCSASFVGNVDQVVLAANDPLAAWAGVQRLRRTSLAPVALSGIVGATGLDHDDAERVTGLQVLGLDELADPHLRLPSPYSGVVSA
jgi:hypothetical protein